MFYASLSCIIFTSNTFLPPQIVSIFEITEGFSALGESGIEGIETTLSKFNTIYSKLKKKPYDILDHRKHDFDQDFVDFKRQILDLEVVTMTYCIFHW